MKHSTFSGIFIVLLTLLNISCKNDPVSSTDIKEGRRDYTWTITKLNDISNDGLFYYLWGSDSANVWCVGSGGDITENVLHYDGKKWSVFTAEQPIIPKSIAGVTEKEFIMGANNGEIWKYSYGKIRKMTSFKIDGYSDIFLTGLWVNNSADIYATGGAYNKNDNNIYGIVTHYNGSQWNILVKPEIKTNFTIIKRGIKESNKYYITARKADTFGNDSSAIYEYDGRSKLTLIKGYTTFEYNTGSNILDGEMFFLFEEKLHKYCNNKFLPIIDFSKTNIDGKKIFGRSINDFFLKTKEGIGHYNGKDLKTLVFGNYVIFDGILFDDHAFFVCHEWGTYNQYILHGKLNKGLMN